MDTKNLAIIVAATINLLLGITVYSKRRESIINKLYGVFAFSVFFWGISMTLYRSAPSVELSISAAKVLYLAPIAIVVSFIFFVKKFPEEQKINSALSTIIIAVASILAYITYTTDSVISSIVFAPAGQEKIIKFGPLYLLYSTYVSAMFLWAYIVLLRKRRRYDNATRTQINYIFSGAFLASFSGMITNLIMPTFGMFYLNWAGQILTLIMIIFIGYAIIAHHLMDIRLVARKYLVTSAYIATVGVFFILTKLIASLFIPKGYENLVDLALLIVAILFTAPIRRFYFRAANKYFFSSLYDSSKLIAEISEGLRSSIELDKIFETIHSSLKKTLHLKAFAVLLYSGKGRTYSIGFNSGFDAGKKKIFASDRYLHKHYTKTNQPIIVEELSRENNEACAKTVELLKSLGIELLIPLNIKNETIGLLALGKKEAGDIYNEDDLNVLKVISSQSAVAIDNAMLYEEVSQFNETLQSKVDEQTKEIQAKAEHLKKLMDMRSEFLDITSHQLRTPVSVIKGVLSMLEEGSVPPDRVKEFIRGAMEKAIKLGEIINDILRASEMDTDKFTMTIRPVDLNEMLEKIKEDKRRTAEMRNIAMVYELPTNLPLVLTDPKYVEHAIVNLINNSLQYTIEGSIVTSAEVTKTHVIIRVTDTGIGIPKEALTKLFTKFARAENAVTTFTDGTGLGLFIIKQIVDANPGAKIEVEKTAVGKGTTFALWLPIAPDPKAKPVKTSAK